MEDDSLFTNYEQDLSQLTTTIQSNLSTQAAQLKGDARRQLLRRIGDEIEEAEEIVSVEDRLERALSQMEIEVQTTQERDKPKLQSKLRAHKLAVGRHKTELATLLSSADRDELLSSKLDTGDHTAIEMDNRAASPSSQAQAQRARLLAHTDQLTEGQRRLEDSHRVALETEVLGAGILSDLRGQRDQLENTRDNLYTADGSIDRASNQLSKMIRRAYQQKAVTYAIVAILIILILYVLYSKLSG